jgi:hypothetical protein
MKTQLFIENYEADISEDISTLLTFELDDVKDFSSRSTTWSKTIVLPGTSANNKLFGHIFQPGISNPFNELADNINFNFNASKAADCIIFQDQLQTFRGVLRLLQINNFKGKFEYEVAVFGELNGLNASLSGSLLENLDFSEYDHIYNASGVVNSWENTSGVGVYYPLIDYGTYSVVKHDWNIRTFRPALHVWEYIDKMFTAAGYRYSSALFDSARFKRLIIPHNQKDMLIGAGDIFNASGTTLQTSSGLLNITFPDQAGGGFTTGDDHTFTFAGVSAITINIDFSITTTAGSQFFEMKVFKNAELIYNEFASPGTTITPIGGPISVSVSPGDTIRFVGDTIAPGFLDATTRSWSASTTATQVVPIDVGDTVLMNDYIPKNIRQIDFLVSIVKLFNLYVYQNQFDSRLIYFTPFVDFFSTDSADSIDWTYKMNRDKVIKVKPMSELNAKIYDFKYKPDTDYFNDQYKKRYGQGYGDYVFDSQFEFAEQKSSLELIFSATPLVGYNGEEKIYPTIFKQSNTAEERIDSNIRILQTKKVTGVTPWDILDGATILYTGGNYGYAGHFDDPDAPSNDLNFGALRELFFTLVSGDLTVTQFNVYWSSYMAEITDKDSKLLSAFFYLKTKDILDLDFSQKIYIDGVLFRLNKIKDFNVTRPTDCEVELIKVNYLIY